MYTLKPSTSFKKGFKKLIKGNIELEKRIPKTLKQSEKDPKMCSHKVGDYWDARVTDDLGTIAIDDFL
jgi:mRNA-degrading endonuclease YafQ of YafQ-DinJ toxin-antitoxin module